MDIKGSVHLCISDRKTIERALNVGMNCKSIAKEICKDERTVSREIKIRRDKRKNGRFENFGKNDLDVCKTLTRFPFVCNNCKRKASCCKEYKYYYDAQLAHEQYQIILKDSRIGLDFSLQDKATFDTILKSGVEKGQALHHIFQANKDKLTCSERAAYRLVDRSQTLVQSIDLVRKVRLKPRKRYVYKEDNRAMREGRKYSDFITYLAQQTFYSGKC